MSILEAMSKNLGFFPKKMKIQKFKSGDHLYNARVPRVFDEKGVT